MKLFRIFLCAVIGLSVACQETPSKEITEEPSVAPAIVSNENSDENAYKGLDEKILKHLIPKEIPADFPKYREGETQEEYKARAIIWGKENLELIKPEYRKKVAEFRTK